jgi:hypothetical protein
MEVAFQFRPPAPRNHNPPLTVRTALCAGKPPHDGLAADNSPSGMRKLRMKPRLRNGRRMPCLLFSPIGEALVFVREAQHLVFGQPCPFWAQVLLLFYRHSRNKVAAHSIVVRSSLRTKIPTISID